jgi:hypothetical protein
MWSDVVSITVSIYSQSPLKPSKISASSFAESALSLHLFNLPVRSSVKKNFVEHGKRALGTLSPIAFEIDLFMCALFLANIKGPVGSYGCVQVRRGTSSQDGISNAAAVSTR